MKPFKPTGKSVPLLASASLAVMTLTVCPASADEGMWTVDNFPAETVAEKYGTVVSDEFLSRLQRATVRVEGGCTGSFASPDGLVLTNHHCVQQCLSDVSSEGDDKRANGFVAATREDEKACKSEQLSVLIGLTDVTELVNEATEGLTREAANRERKATLTRLESECTAEAPGGASVCEAVTLYNGGQYFLYHYKRYDDVRLVFAPEQSIAAFGGDPDNFNFPRWCLDMALLRVWEDGRPAQTPTYLSWKRDGAAEGETVFITGHPGTTQRLLTVAELDFRRSLQLPEWIERNAELRGRLIQYSKSSEEASRTSYRLLQSLENGLKVQRNRLRALLNDDMMRAKHEAEATLRRAMADRNDVDEELGNPWQQAEAAMESYRDFYVRYNYIENSAAFGRSALQLRKGAGSRRRRARKTRQ